MNDPRERVIHCLLLWHHFVHRWLHATWTAATDVGPVYASELADQLINDAAKEGITADEMEEEAGSVFELVLSALEQREQA